jgi:hypothetical protein
MAKAIFGGIEMDTDGDVDLRGTAITSLPVAGAVNIGSASTGASSGTGTGGSGFAVNDAGFNWAAYCNGPDSRGSMRSPLWIANCLAASP